MDLPEKLKRWRKGVLNVSQEVLARDLGLTRSTYASYEQGAAAVPSAVLRRIEDMGFTTVSEVGSPLGPLPVPVTLIPKGPQVPCSSWSDPLDTDYNEFAEVDSYMAGKGRFSCEVVGDSMFDLIWPGDMCVFQSSQSPKLGSIVIARTPRNEATVAQLKHDGTSYVLHKLNPKYPPVTAEQWEVIGYLVGVIRIEGTRRTAVFDPSGIRP
jgi:SOS-response transcriptional repressor LexA